MEPYNGSGGYAFVSYSHKDRYCFFPIMEKLIKSGVHLWWDEGINPVEEWAESIANKLKNASIMIICISKNSINSQNVRREIYYAVSKEIPILSYFYDITVEELPDGLALQLGISQVINADSYADKDQVAKKISGSVPQKAKEKENKKNMIFSGYSYSYWYEEPRWDLYYADICEIYQFSHETQEIKKIASIQISDAFTADFRCEAIERIHKGEFNSFNTDVLLFKIFIDARHELGVLVPQLFIEYNIAIYEPEGYKANPKIELLNIRTKLQDEEYSIDREDYYKKLGNDFKEYFKIY